MCSHIDILIVGCSAFRILDITVARSLLRLLLSLFCRPQIRFI